MVPNCKSTAFSPLGSSARNAISNAVAALQPAACSLAVCNLLPAALSAALPAALTAALQCATRCLPLQPCGAQPAACNLATCCLQPCSLAVQRLGLPGRTFTLSTFRAGLWPACYGEGTKSAGRRPDFGAFPVGSRLAKTRPGRPIYGPEALLRDIYGPEALLRWLATSKSAPNLQPGSLQFGPAPWFRHFVHFV